MILNRKSKNYNCRYNQISTKIIDRFMNNYFGDGSDGILLVDNGKTFNLEKDYFYNNIQVNPLGKINTNGFRLFVKNILINNGFIGIFPNSVVGQMGGKKTNIGTLNGGSAGGDGGILNNGEIAPPLAGSTSTNVPYYYENLFKGGNGGGEEAEEAGEGGNILSDGGDCTLHNILEIFKIKNLDNISFTGGSGGGGGHIKGGLNEFGTGGGGGSGGATYSGQAIAAWTALWACYTLPVSPASAPTGNWTVTLSINNQPISGTTVQFTLSGSGGGGGGGGGGLIIYVTTFLDPLQKFNVSGGLGGSGFAKGNNGSNGAMGKIYGIIL